MMATRDGVMMKVMSYGVMLKAVCDEVMVMTIILGSERDEPIQ
jgi:hypothetical protein